MKKRAAVAMAGFGGGVSALVAIASCGSRTGLPLEEVVDAAPEHGLFNPDRFVMEDVPDVKDVAVEEALPGIDVNRPDVIILTPCPDASATLIYVMGMGNTLYSFDPATRSFATIGKISCPGATGTPFSMAVDRAGVAYVGFSGQMGPTNQEFGTGLFRVDTKTAGCTATTYNEAMNGMFTFGMGFVALAVDGGVDGGIEGGTLDQLFISLDVGGITANGVLSTLDTTTFLVTKIGPFSPTPLPAAELTGTGDGRLFAFSPGTTDGGTFIAQVDPMSAKVIGADTIDGVVQGSGWAFGFWGGNFYTFTAPAGMTTVDEFNPMTKVVTHHFASIDDIIVGAGVSTCAPASGM
jgi:hypothetical protein